MLSETASLKERLRVTVNGFRVAVLVTIAFLALLMVSVALTASIYDVSDKGMTVIGIVLAALPTLITSLLVYLKIDNVEVKADHAARRATVAAKRAEVVESKVDAVHHDVLNGGLRDNVKRAISEDRHDLRQRETAERMREQLRERGISHGDHHGGPQT